MMVCNPSDDICCHMWWQHICDDITSRSVMSDSLWPQDCSPLGSSVHGDSPGKNTRVGCYFLLQGLFPTQGLNPGLPHHRWILYYLSHQGSPNLGQNHLRSCWRGEPPGLSNWIFLVWVQCTNQSASAGWSITLVILSSHESLGLSWVSVWSHYLRFLFPEITVFSTMIYERKAPELFDMCNCCFWMRRRTARGTLV